MKIQSRMLKLMAIKAELRLHTHRSQLERNHFEKKGKEKVIMQLTSLSKHFYLSLQCNESLSAFIFS